MKNRKKVRSLLLLLIMLLGLLSGCKAEARKTFQKLEDFAQARIGVLTGSSQELIVKSRFPQAERIYFSRPADMVLAVEQGKIDGYMFGSPFLVSNLWEKSNIKRIEEAVAHGDIAFAFPKEESSDPLREQLNGFLKQAREDGTLAQLEAKWLGKTEPTQHPDYTSLTGENGTIRLAAVAENKPLIYQYQNQCTGYEMEILTLFAQQYGYRFDVEIVPFESVIIGMATGKYDMTSASLQITPEREESVNFSDPYMQFDVVMVVKGDGEPSAEKTLADLDSTTIGIVTGTTWDEVAQKTFPNAERKYFNSDAKLVQTAAKGVARVYSRFIAGTPVVVILMILFYVVFGRFQDMSGIVVAIIGFTLTFGAFVYDHMTVSVNSVDRGQNEAAYSLGYPKNKAFFRIVFPQAMTIFLPSYCGQAVELIKATAVVGYIAVNDLTKMGDIIRSNTYEAFFPLIATAVIYFLLTWLMSLLLNLVKLHFEPKRRKKEDILKGIVVG